MKGHRIFVEKYPAHAIDSIQLYQELRTNVQISGLKGIRSLMVYDIFGMSLDEFRAIVDKVFCERPRATWYNSFEKVLSPPERNNVQEHYDIEKDYSAYCAFEYLPGQYDQCADAAEQCLHLLGYSEAKITTAQLVLLYGELSPEDQKKISEHCINTIEMREKDILAPCVLPQYEQVLYYDTTISGFIDLSIQELEQFRKEKGLSMSAEDLSCIQSYFKHETHNNISRNPTLTEIRMLDTYWSDHCRHSTFNTHLDAITLPEGPWQRGYDIYLELRETLHRTQHAMSLMDMATIASRHLIQAGKAKDIDFSEEVNACSIRVNIDYHDGDKEPWLLMFKNETHNHPTEIEPYGGAATCLGGAMRDIFSGRAPVFSAMRISGAANICEAVSQTLTHKLPQRYISQHAAKGFSSYGNQAGIPTHYVREIFHEGYKAKRLEAGFVMGAAPEHTVIRNTPSAGDLILLVGGRTGRDGIGGAVGSSRPHTERSLHTACSEVQKGNPVEAHALQRFFSNPEVAKLIKRCNDFGAGGIAVAVGELADGIHIKLDDVPVKYHGLDGTELLLSESQERMAVVIDPNQKDSFMRYATAENLEATEIARVSSEARVRIEWRGNVIVDIARDFLNQHGAKRHAEVEVAAVDLCRDTATEKYYERLFEQAHMLEQKIIEMISSQQLGSQQGIQEQFDSSIGARTVLVPYGGYTQDSQAEGSAVLMPTTTRSNTVALSAAACPISLLDLSPYHGAAFAVVESLAKIVAMGGDYRKSKLSFQEFFPRTESPELWGLPAAALLGALEAQYSFEVAAIGGKDSMSGNYEELKVPPTFISFAVTSEDIDKIRSTEFHTYSQHIYLLEHLALEDGTPNYELLKHQWNWFILHNERVSNAVSLGEGGLIMALLKMCFGNNIGARCEIDRELVIADFLTLESKKDATEVLIYNRRGSILFATKAEINLSTEEQENLNLRKIGTSTEKGGLELSIQCDTATDQSAAQGSNANSTKEFSWDLATLKELWKKPLSSVFPTHTFNDTSQDAQSKKTQSHTHINLFSNSADEHIPQIASSKPRVCIPVFPGTNCEYDTKAAIEYFGAICSCPIFLNKSKEDIQESIQTLGSTISESQILILAGGFSLGDQPDGSGKYIANVLLHPIVAEAMQKLLDGEGLILGICNGFQALMKSGWLPSLNPHPQTDSSPSLTTNTQGHHISFMSEVEIKSTLTPWASLWKEGDILTLPLSHGEGRFFADEGTAQKLFARNQVISVYNKNLASPNGSVQGIEGISSPDGKIFGRMGHAERIMPGTFKNIPDSTHASLSKSLLMFKAGVEHIKSS